MERLNFNPQPGPSLLGGTVRAGAASASDGPLGQPRHSQPLVPAAAESGFFTLAASQARARGPAAQELCFSQYPPSQLRKSQRSPCVVVWTW